MDRLRIIRWMTLCFCAVAISLRGSAEPARADEDAAANGAMPFYAYCMEDGVPGMQPRPVAEQAAILAALGYDGAGYVLWLDDQLEKNLAALRRAGLKLYMAYTFLDLKKPGQPYDRRVPEAIARLKGQPATVCVLLSGRKPGDPRAMEPAVRALRELADAAAKAGVRISIYNHVGDWTERVSFALEVVKKVDRPNVGVNFNLCHWLMVEGRKDYRPLIRGNASKIFNVTICGAQVGAKTWRHGLIQPLDCGDFDNRQLLATLREAGYQGPIGLMCESIPDDLQEHLARSMKLWRILAGRHPVGLEGLFQGGGGLYGCRLRPQVRPGDDHGRAPAEEGKRRGNRLDHQRRVAFRRFPPRGRFLVVVPVCRLLRLPRAPGQGVHGFLRSPWRRIEISSARGRRRRPPQHPFHSHERQKVRRRSGPSRRSAEAPADIWR